MIGEKARNFKRRFGRGKVGAVATTPNDSKRMRMQCRMDRG
jgi:hypothetical protein